MIATGAVLALGTTPGDPLDDPGPLADVPFVLQGGRVLKWAGGNARAGLSGVAPYFPA